MSISEAEELVGMMASEKSDEILAALGGGGALGIVTDDFKIITEYFTLQLVYPVRSDIKLLSRSGKNHVSQSVGVTGSFHT